MSEDNGVIDGTAHEVEPEGPEYSFIIEKRADGNYELKPGDPAPPTLDEVYNACSSVQRNIAAQQTAAAVHNLMAQAAQAVHAAQGANRTEGGLIVPNDVQTKG